MSKLDQYRRLVNRAVIDYERAKSIEKWAGDQLNRDEQELEAIMEAQQLVQSVAETIQQQVHRQVSKVVQRCLNTVFSHPYQFEIRFERRRGKTEAKMVFMRDGMEMEDPLNEVGGGVIDVAALGLRLARILMARPAMRKLVVLDEPFKNIRGKGNKERTRQMLLALSQELGIQFIVNTEIEAYQLGTVVEIV